MSTAVLTLIASELVTLYLFRDTAASIVSAWHRSESFAHGYIVLPISLYLIWTRRRYVTDPRLSPNPWGLVILVGLGCVWLLGKLADVLVVQQLAMVAIVQGLVWTILGSTVTRALLFPLLFAWFAVPLGEELVPALQDFTTRFTVEALQISGIPVFTEGTIIALPSYTWEVAKDCSGVRYVIPSLMLGCLYAYLTYRNWGRRLSFVILSGVVSILANGVRAYGIVMLGFLSDNRLAVGVDHLIYGWLFFGMVMVFLFGLGRCWREPLDTDETEDVSHLAPRSNGSNRGSNSAPTAFALTAVSSVVVLALGPFFAGVIDSEPPRRVTARASVPNVVQPWEEQKDYEGKWVPHFIGADAEVMQSYRLGSHFVHLYIAYYARQRQGAEVINSENVIADEQEWPRLNEGQTQAEIDGERMAVRATALGPRQHGQLVWSWYWIGGRFTANPYFAKWLQVQARLLGMAPAAAVVAVITDYQGEPGEASVRLQDFMRHVSSLQATLRSVVVFPAGESKVSK